MTRLTVVRPDAPSPALARSVELGLWAAARYARRGSGPARVVAPPSHALFATVREIARLVGVHPEAELHGDAVTITFTPLPADGHHPVAG